MFKPRGLGRTFAINITARSQKTPLYRNSNTRKADVNFKRMQSDIR